MFLFDAGEMIGRGYFCERLANSLILLYLMVIIFGLFRSGFMGFIGD
jgi:hypothetical protein